MVHAESRTGHRSVVWSPRGNDDWDAQAENGRRSIPGSADIKFKAGYADDATVLGAESDRALRRGRTSPNGGPLQPRMGRDGCRPFTGYVNVGVGYNVGDSSVAANLLLLRHQRWWQCTAVPLVYGQSMGAGVESLRQLHLRDLRRRREHQWRWSASTWTMNSGTLCHRFPREVQLIHSLEFFKPLHERGAVNDSPLLHSEKGGVFICRPV